MKINLEKLRRKKYIIEVDSDDYKHINKLKKLLKSRKKFIIVPDGFITKITLLAKK